MKLLKSRNSASRKKANSKTISKASQEAIDESVLNSEIRYVAGDSFRSVASSVTAPPSMTASFYEKALAGWNLDDDDDDNDDDYDAARSVDGSENNWGGSEHPSTDSRSVDLNSEDGCCNGSKGSKDGSKGSSSKGSKKGKKKKKFRLGGKKKSIMAQSKEGLPKQETVIEETHIESEDGSVIDDHFDYENDHHHHHHQYETWDDDGVPLDVSENINDADDIYGYEDAEPKDRPKAFRKKGRRSSLGDTAWPPPPPPPEEEHKNRRRNSLLASLLMGGSGHNVVAPPPPPPPPPEKEYPSPKSRGPSPKQRRPRRNSLFGSVYKTHDEEEQQQHQKDQKASPKQHKPSPKQRRRRSMFGSSTTDGESSIAGTASTQSPIIPKIPKDVHKIVNQERIAREMEPFHRNMLLDTLAQSLATDMSVGRQSGGCDYHGNVGQGVSLQMIHTTLMENRSGPARKNILSTKFTDFGMSVVPGRGPNEGILFMCQLFK